MILVTGATGTVGRQVVAQLRERGEPVRAAVRQCGRPGRPGRVRDQAPGRAGRIDRAWSWTGQHPFRFRGVGRASKPHPFLISLNGRGEDDGTVGGDGDGVLPDVIAACAAPAPGESLSA